MKPQPQPKSQPTKRTDWLILATAVVAGIVLLLIFPEKQQLAGITARRFATEMFTILPAVLILMGLFTVWVSKEMVMQYLGQSSGLKGMVLALFFGALPTGPLYIAFPLAAGLRQKGASLANIAIFLTAWACIKLPQELVELQFLGAQFMLARLSLTILAAVAMGAIIEKIVKTNDVLDNQSEENKP